MATPGSRVADWSLGSCSGKHLVSEPQPVLVQGRTTCQTCGHNFAMRVKQVCYRFPVVRPRPCGGE